jgi:predicted MPP superfamily phosphohydrolase
MSALFRWLHLSDIHVGHGDAEIGWDQRLVMDTLRRDAVEIAKKSPVDAIFVTGDIAFSGAGRSADEYERARAWLLALGKDLGLGPEKIYLVPGNHDVNRAADKDRNTQRLVASLREGTDKIDTALTDAGDRALLASRMKKYLELAADFAPACAGAAAPIAERLYWTHRITARDGLALRILGINTALLAADDKDQGRLALGSEQITRALTDPPVEPNELVIVLSHHPLQDGWLRDQASADAWIKSRAHVHLSGHVHLADSQQSRSGSGRGFVRITAGATHGEAEHGAPPSHGYSFGEVIVKGGKAELHVHPRKWADKSKRFVTDVENVPDGQTFAEHDLQVLLAAPAGGGTTAAIDKCMIKVGLPSHVSPSRPLRVFISYTPAYDALRAELETHLKLLKRQGLIESYSAAQIGAGGESAIDTHPAGLRNADVILLLVSTDYLVSDVQYDELEAAIARHDRGEARVIPILIRECDFTGAPFAKLRMVPPYPSAGAPKPVTSFPATGGKHDEGFKQVAIAVRSAVWELRVGPA